MRWKPFYTALILWGSENRFFSSIPCICAFLFSLLQKLKSLFHATNRTDRQEIRAHNNLREKRRLHFLACNRSTAMHSRKFSLSADCQVALWLEGVLACPLATTSLAQTYQRQITIARIFRREDYCMRRKKLLHRKYPWRSPWQWRVMCVTVIQRSHEKWSKIRSKSKPGGLRIRCLWHLHRLQHILYFFRIYWSGC